MAIAGQSNVTATGAFTYTIPIPVPPGTAGMVPSIALQYSSQNGDGFEGIGWTLTGLPSITRCPRTIAQDGVHGGVNFGADGDGLDRFCLDGQRLVAVNGTYGADNTEYRTEIESFSKIVSHGSSGSGPAYFTVQTKSGQTMEFGYTTNSKAPLVAVANSIPSNEVTGPAGTIRAWAVDKISDMKGNYLKVTYNFGTQDTTNGQIYPTKIIYTGNDGNSPLTPYNSIQFSYDLTRNDITASYHAGSLLRTTKLLSEIKTCTSTSDGCDSGSVVSDFTLTYNPASANSAQHDQLKTLTLCDGSGAHCLPATQFSWQGTRDGLDLKDAPNGTPNGQFQAAEGGFAAPLYPGDFNGDGLLDVIPIGQIYPKPCGIFVGSQGGTSFTAGPSATWSSGDYGGPNDDQYIPLTGTLCEPGKVDPKYAMGDIDGDGFTDFSVQGLVADHSTKREIVWSNRSGALVQQPPASNPSYTAMGDHEFADFDGDGRTDFFDGTNVWFSNGDGTFPRESAAYSNLTGHTLIPDDFDGDGCADILAQTSNAHKIQYMCNPAVGSVSVPNWVGNGFVITVGDFNGDGVTDVLRTGNDGQVATLFLGTGTGFVVAWTDPGGHSWEKWTIVAGDWNGDGKTDVLLVADDCICNPDHYGPGTPHQLWLSTGSGFVQAKDLAGTLLTLPNPSGSGDGNIEGYPRIVGWAADWNNDGASDIWLKKKSGDTEFLFNFVPELMTTVDNGNGSVVSVKYDRLNEATVGGRTFYTKATDSSSCAGAAPSSCTQNLDGPLYVVSEIDKSNGLGTCNPQSHANCYWSSYAYTGAKTDLFGRGFLGFQKIEATDQLTNLIQTTTYRTDFPFVGLVASQATKCPAGVCISSDITLSSMTNTYGSIVLQPGTSKKRWFVELQQTVSNSYDTDNSALPSVQTTYSYDCDSANVNQINPCFGDAGVAPNSIVETTTYNAETTSTKSTTNTYTDDSAHWILGRLRTTSVTSTVIGQSAITRSSSFNYDLSGSTPSGLLTEEIIEPSDTTTACLYLDTTYQYDDFGNRKSATKKGYNAACGTARTNTANYAYDGSANYGQFATTISNAMSPPESESWDYITGSNSGRAFGVALSHTGPNGLTTSWKYDWLGRSIEEDEPDGAKNLVVYDYCQNQSCTGLSQSAPAKAAFYAEKAPKNSSNQQIGSIAIVYYDALDRIVGKDTQGFDGTWIRTEIVYDKFGRVLQTNRPYFLTGGTPAWTTNSYVNQSTQLNDPLGRVQKITPPNDPTGFSGGYTTFTYTGLTTSVFVTPKNPDGSLRPVQTTTTVKNPQGFTASVTNSLGFTTHYTYDSEGDLITVTDPSPAHNQIQNTFDKRGRKSVSVDPDMGSWSYGYDAFGELITQRDAKAQTTTLKYDAAGRLTHRVENSFTSNWIYGTDSAQFNVGKLIQECTTATSTKTDCSSLQSSDFLRAFTYNSNGLLATDTSTIDGTPYQYSASYFQGQRPNIVTRPSGLKVDYSYVPYGYISLLADHVSGAALWTPISRDAEGHLTSASLGNDVNTTELFDWGTGLPSQIRAGTNDAVANLSYGFDSIGVLHQRSDMLVNGGTTEMMCYTDLNQLKQYSIDGSACDDGEKKTVSYDNGDGEAGIGNITKKTDVSVADGYHYGENGAGPHQLTSITSCDGCFAVDGVTNPSFQYDADGNLECILSAGQTCNSLSARRFITWTSFNMVDIISESGTHPSGIQLKYGPDHARFKMCAPACNSNSTSTTRYLNGFGQMEEQSVTGNTTTWRDYIQGDGKLVAERIKAGTTTTNYYFVTDHLGSVSVITDDSGNVLTDGQGHEIGRLSYDPWGKRRDGSTWADIGDCAAPPVAGNTTRGFTGHEEIDSLCLVNANARVYDPTVGKFMSADEIVPDPYNGQSYNRYAYVNNDPLSVTDPTGHVPGVETVVVTAMRAAEMTPSPVQPILIAADIVITLIEGGSMLGLGNPAVAVQPALSVAAPHTAVSPTAGGNQAGITPTQNSAIQSQEASAASPTPTSATATAAQSPASTSSDSILSATSPQSVPTPANGTEEVAHGVPDICHPNCYDDPNGGWGWGYSTPGTSTQVETVYAFHTPCGFFCQNSHWLLPVAANTVMLAAVIAGGGPEDPLGDAAGLAAREAILETGSTRATVFAGHGFESALAGTTTVPDGVAITLPGQPGLAMPDALGQLVEANDWEAVAANARYATMMEGSTTYLPGAQVPNLVLSPAGDLETLPGSFTVQADTPLSDLLSQARGLCVWAACRTAP